MDTPDFERMSIPELKQHLARHPVLIDTADVADEWRVINAHAQRNMRRNREEDSFAVNSDADEILRMLGENPTNVLLLNIMSFRRLCTNVAKERRKAVVNYLLYAVAQRASFVLLGIQPTHKFDYASLEDIDDDVVAGKIFHILHSKEKPRTETDREK